VDTMTEIYVALSDEAVDVWRPVKAEHLHGNVYRISDQAYDREIESWQFVPGDEVVCELIDSNGDQILAAIRRASGSR
jgi:hypothetical protein